MSLAPTQEPPFDPAAERRLIAAAQRGDRAAFDRIVRRYQGYLYRLMVRACHHPQDAEEVVAEAFLQAYRHLTQFQHRSSFVSWLGRIATQLCARRREREVALPSSLEASGGDEALSSELPTPEEQALKTELRWMVHSAVAELPEPDQTILRLRDIEQLSTAEVSQKTGLTEAAVKARLHRARSALRVRLNRYFLGTPQ